jgi:deoxyribodipyrimidine photolyase-related protein
MREDPRAQLEAIAPGFAKELAACQSKSSSKAPRTWIYAHEDQLTSAIGPLSQLDPASAGLIILEDHPHAKARPFHRQRLAIIFANQRHFALEQARRGVLVQYRIAASSLADELIDLHAQLQLQEPICMMMPAEHRARAILVPVASKRKGKHAVLKMVPHAGWLTSYDQFLKAHPDKPYGPWKMDSFYRHVRKITGILMEPDGSYEGGKVSFDTDNRKPFTGAAGDPKPVSPPSFSPDAITREVLEMIARDFAEHPGLLDASSIPATSDDARALWAWALKHCLTHFGPYEDAMTVKHRTLFHTRISTLVNLHRLLPIDVVKDVEKAKIPLQSKEGFIRQMLGWREFMKHVHDATEGFRMLHARPVPLAASTGDGGYAAWAGKPWPQSNVDSQATPHPILGLPAAIPGQIATGRGDDGSSLPPAFWQNAHHHAITALAPAPTHPSGMNCLDTVVRSVWEEAWSHHITRLMILGNLSTLLDFSARTLTDWFHLAYSDAWDWVVEPNVLGMATFSTGEVFTTKPYVSGAAYIDKMSDYCSSCQFDPSKNCPITRLYWAFLERHKPRLEGNARIMMPMRSLAKRSDEQKSLDAATFAFVRASLLKGEKLTPLTISRGTSSAAASQTSLPSPSRSGAKK